MYCYLIDIFEVNLEAVLFISPMKSFKYWYKKPISKVFITAKLSTLTENLAVPWYLDFETFYDFWNFFGSGTELYFS